MTVGRSLAAKTQVEDKVLLDEVGFDVPDESAVVEDERNLQSVTGCVPDYTKDKKSKGGVTITN